MILAFVRMMLIGEVVLVSLFLGGYKERLDSYPRMAFIVGRTGSSFLPMTLGVGAVVVDADFDFFAAF